MQRSNLNEVAAALANALFCGERELCLHLLRLLANGQPVSAEQPAWAAHGTRSRAHCADCQTPSLILLERLWRRVSPCSRRLTGLRWAGTCSTPGARWIRSCILSSSSSLPAWLPLVRSRGTHPPLGHTRRDRSIVTTRGVVSLVIPQQAEACRGVRGAFCNQVHFFSSREMASTWLEQRPTALLLSTDEAFHLGQMVVRYRYQELLGA